MTQPTITTGMKNAEVFALANAVNPAVKNATEATTYLANKGWTAPGEIPSLEVLSRVLFAAVIHSKLTTPISSTIAAVAYLLTEKQTIGIMENLVDNISLHIKDTLDSITTDMHVKLDQHIQAVNDTTQKQTDLTDKLLKAQEKMEETTRQAITTTKTYSQAAAAAPAHAPQPAPPMSISQIRMRNREEIKWRQVLIEFDRNQDLQLENMSDTVLARKAKDAINTVWVISPKPGMDVPAVKAAVLLRNGGLLLEMNKAEDAKWLREETNRKKILDNIGTGASIKDRTYQVIVQFIPIQFDPQNEESLRHVESSNGLKPKTIMKAEWVKPVKDRREGQKVATARIYLKDANTANTILSTNVYIRDKKVIPKKPRKEPIRCLKCQMFGHKRRHCTVTEARCARCARRHETEECITLQRDFKCSNCGGQHPSYNRDCPAFEDKCEQLNERCPENRLAFYPTNEPWLWANADTRLNINQDDQHQRDHDENRPEHRTTPPARLTGTNGTPLGPQRTNEAQPHPMNRNTHHCYLRILQQNLNKSLTAQLHLLNTAKPTEWDILLIQEPWIAFNGTRATQKWRVLYPKIYFENNAKPLRSLILVNSDVPTNQYEQIQFDTADVTSIIIRRENIKIIIVNVYNDCNNNEAITAVSEFLSNKFLDDFVPDDTHVIIGGDFNRHHSWWESEDNVHLTSAEHQVGPILDLTARFNLRMALPPYIPTLQAFSTGNWTCPDNVWCTSHTTDLFVKCTTDPGTRAPNTDHLPIHFELNLRIMRNDPKPTRNFRAADWTEVNKHLATTLADAPDPSRIHSPEEFREALNTINGALKAAVEMTIPMNNPIPHTKRWWNHNLMTARRNKNKLANLAYKWRGLPDHHSHADHKRATKDYAKLIEESKKAHWEAWLLDAAERDLWTANKYATGPPSDGGKTRMPTLNRTNADGTVHRATSNEDKSKTLAKSLFPPPPPNPIIPDTHYPRPVDNYFHFFTRNQIKQAAAKLNAYKAPGPDRIPNVVLRECIGTLTDHLYFIFRVIFELSVYPDEWRESITVVLRKLGKPSYEDPKAYRPIARLNTMGKLFSTIATDEISYFCKTRNLLPATQFGGRPARTTTDSMLLMTHTIKEAWRKREVASVLFLDVQGAFPNVVKEVLIHNMRTQGVPSQYIQMTQLMLTDRQTRLSFDDYLSDPVAITNGNNQGCPLSMMFYTFYNAGLLELSVPNSADERQFGFVDDVALLATARTIEEAHQKLKNMMERPGGALGWSRTHNSPFEMNKLALMNFSPKSIDDTPLTIARGGLNGDTTIKAMTTYRFLGVLFDPKLRWKAQHEKATRTTEAWINLVKRLARTASGISAGGMRQLYLAVAAPKMTYAVEVWYTLPHKSTPGNTKRTGSIKFTKGIQSAQRRAVITMLGAMRTTAGNILNAHALIPPPHLLFLTALTRSATRLVSLPNHHPLYKPTQQCLRRSAKRHSSPLQVLLRMTGTKNQSYETILPARRRRDYEMLASVHIDTDRAKATTNAKAITGLTAWTDGSGLDGKIGAAAVLMLGDTKLRTLRYRLGNETNHTVYEAELVAVILALHTLMEMDRCQDSVTIRVDNQAVLLGLQNQRPKPGHYLLDKIHDTLEDLQVRQVRNRGCVIEGYRIGRGRVRLDDGTQGWRNWKLKQWCKVKFVWVPGHEGVEGNEAADEEAKLATEDGSSPNRKLPAFLR